MTQSVDRSEAASAWDSRRIIRLSQWTVWAVWLATVSIMLVGMARWSSPIPLAEDWVFVSPLTAHEANLATWAWAQNNEHRTPVSRLLLLGVLETTHGDFRAGGYLSIACLGAASALLIILMKRLRGHTDVADAFFPLLLLHFGHSVQVLFGWQFTVVLPIAMTLLIGRILFAPGSVANTAAASIAGACLVLLPLCGGGNGLLYVPAIGAFLLYAGQGCWTGHRGWPRRRGLAASLLGWVTLAVVVSVLYFIGYQQPTWNPPSHGLSASIKSAVRVLALGFGPVALRSWKPFALAALALAIATAWIAARACLRQNGFARERCIGGTIFLANAVGAACLIGWVRAGYVPQSGIPARYALLVAPAFCGVFVAWEVFASPAPRRLIQRGLAATMLVLLPLNTLQGGKFARWYIHGMNAVQSDLRQDLTFDEIAIRHCSFLVHWWTPAELARQMQWLRNANIRPFARPTQVANDTGTD